MFGMGIVELIVFLLIALIIFGLPVAILVAIIVLASKKRRGD